MAKHHLYSADTKHLLVVGTGYVGLVTGAGLASLGHTVTCVDNVTCIIHAIKSGHLPIYEHGLEDLITAHHNNVTFTDNLAFALTGAIDAIFIAVPTPENGKDGGADISILTAVVKEIAERLTKPCTIIIKS